MKVGLLTFEQHLGKKDVGSSRIRGHWIVNHWKQAGQDIGDCELFRYGQKYDAVIFQKAYFIDYAKSFKGLKILDLCDPDWMHWSYRVKEMIEEVDAITCSSLELTKAVSKFAGGKPVYFIPDRVMLDAMPAPKVHVGPTTKVVWYGYSHNFPILDSCIKFLAEQKLHLIVVADNVYTPPAAFTIELTNLPFSQYHLTDIQSADVVINPRFNKGKWKYKSTNKTEIAKALGMPVAHTADELKELMTEEQRIKASEAGLKDVRENFDVNLSVIDYKDILLDLAKTKNV